MRTTSLVLGFIAAAMLFFAGCTGTVFGSCAAAFEESFDIEETAEGAESTSEDVSVGGIFAVVTAVILCIAAGLAKSAHKTSLGLFVASMLALILTVVVDTTSLFALAYYLAILIVAACIVLMLLALRNGRDPQIE